MSEDNIDRAIGRLEGQLGAIQTSITTLSAQLAEDRQHASASRKMIADRIQQIEGAERAIERRIAVVENEVGDIRGTVNDLKGSAEDFRGFQRSGWKVGGFLAGAGAVLGVTATYLAEMLRLK